MKYYTFVLDWESQDLRTIITPYGRYKNAHLPMGCKCSPDITQGIMEHVLSGNIDDIGAFSKDWNKHVQLLSEFYANYERAALLLTCLNAYGPSRKLTGLAGLHKVLSLRRRNDAILYMDSSHSATELCMFMECVNYYSNMWPSHVNIPIPWQITLIWRNVLQHLGPMKCSKPLKKIMCSWLAMRLWPTLIIIKGLIYTDASDFQLGVCIVQEGRPVAYFSCKMSKSQQNDTVMEKEMLFFVGTLEALTGTLLGADFMFLQTIKTWYLIL